VNGESLASFDFIESRNKIKRRLFEHAIKTGRVRRATASEPQNLQFNTLTRLS
jgi:hypothetical protein